jgi:hypothetical protein
MESTWRGISHVRGLIQFPESYLWGKQMVQTHELFICMANHDTGATGYSFRGHWFFCLFSYFSKVN